MPTDSIAKGQIRLDEQRRELEIQLTGAIVARPLAGIRAARHSGMTPDTITWDDLRIILGALRTLHEQRLRRRPRSA
jgi:hypothetical protein